MKCCTNSTNSTILLCFVLLFVKVQIFWEGLKNLAHLQFFIWYYLVVSNFKWKIGQIFVDFLEYPNFIFVVSSGS